MKSKKVISTEDIPISSPASLTISIGLLLDRFDAAGWLWGVFGTVFAIIWVCVIVRRLTEKPTRIFGDES